MKSTISSVDSSRGHDLHVMINALIAELPEGKLLDDIEGNMQEIDRNLGLGLLNSDQKEYKQRLEAALTASLMLEMNLLDLERTGWVKRDKVVVLREILIKEQQVVEDHLAEIKYKK